MFKNLGKGKPLSSSQGSDLLKLSTRLTMLSILLFLAALILFLISVVSSDSMISLISGNLLQIPLATGALVGIWAFITRITPDIWS